MQNSHSLCEKLAGSQMQITHKLAIGQVMSFFPFLAKLWVLFHHPPSPLYQNGRINGKVFHVLGDGDDWHYSGDTEAGELL